jgi:tetratricopeptide (TPR) repeat protein
MKVIAIVSILCAIFLSGCANPINRITSDNYSDTCGVAEKNRRLDIAEEACYRALVNVDWGNLGPELKSQKQYNLGRIKRQLGKFSEAEQLFKAALKIEQALPKPSTLRVSRRHIELATSLAGQNKWQEGAKYLDLAIPSIPNHSKRERKFLADMLITFSKELQNLGEKHLANHFKKVAEAVDEET